MLKEIIERRSCRNFDPNKMVKDEDIDKIVKAGLMAPSAKNLQDGKIIVIKDKKVRDELGLHIPLLLDTKGPEIRIGKFENNEIFLNEGDIFTLTNILFF